MKNPKILTTINTGSSYILPTYRISDVGIEDGDGLTMRFCKGNKSDSTVFRQECVFTESLIQLAKQYLESVNSG